MPRTRENIARHEWIGLGARVEQSTDPSTRGVAGRVVDETLRTVTIERPDGREVKVQKAGTVLALTLPGGGEVPLPLGQLVFRPQDRVKRAQQRRARATAGGVA